uniref:Uncharacterized protein n=1 Tax=Timema tahoe TaxID=61484 RepID=A0A7R9IRI8_9NEOP|nr:unnamed protein product [Timema tahoe]
MLSFHNKRPSHGNFRFRAISVDALKALKASGEELIKGPLIYNRRGGRFRELVKIKMALRRGFGLSWRDWVIGSLREGFVKALDAFFTVIFSAVLHWSFLNAPVGLAFVASPVLQLIPTSGGEKELGFRNKNCERYMGSRGLRYEVRGVDLRSVKATETLRYLGIGFSLWSGIDVLAMKSDLNKEYRVDNANRAIMVSVHMRTERSPTLGTIRVDALKAMKASGEELIKGPFIYNWRGDRFRELGDQNGIQVGVSSREKLDLGMWG